ncbi:AcrR family transcriptional regulator [Nocardia transvalensis]|uniref:AcrR family transcriptional regulator n=1 Tax=Nocardia transvalensis TaxID=37333 RepID=A0A7W9PBR9_9NOCA|nr:TetR/AcrR family transcriptional regulator [Nocardia transvalensis]MBB5912758.1 AcrR family transcriptional regulator [Nocardia transvalensis]
MQVTRRAAPDRREQLLRATVEVLAELGYERTSFARIVEHARMSSTRLISYHFESKDALMAEALEYVVRRAGVFMRRRIDEADGGPAKLAAYIRGNLEFLAAEPACAQAAVAIVSHLRTRPGAAQQNDVSVALLEASFVAAQAAGEMRRFDPTVMAVSVRAAIDAAVGRMVSGDVDLGRYAEELVDIFDAATRMHR